MGYAIVVGSSALAGVLAYAVTMRRSSPRARWTSRRASRSFEPSMQTDGEPLGVPGVNYIPVGADNDLSWQTRSISVLGLVALILTVATVIGAALYQFGGMLIRFVIHKIQNS